MDDILVNNLLFEQHLGDLDEIFNVLRRYQMKLNPIKCVFIMMTRKFLGFMVSNNGIELNPKKLKALVNMSPPKTLKQI